MAVDTERAFHVLLRHGLFPLERAYYDLPPSQRAHPAVRQAMDALHDLEVANGFGPGRRPLDEPLVALAAAWSKAPKDLGPDDVIDRWEARHVDRGRSRRAKGVAS